MSSLSTSFILGYHGCDRSVADEILRGSPFKPSENSYDWLGHGIYFWEANPRRALDFAKEMKILGRPKENPIKEPCVVGAIIDLGNCLDLMSMAGIDEVQAAYEKLKDYHDSDATLAPLPNNSGGPHRIFRNLDCAVINHLHLLRDGMEGSSIIGDNLIVGEFKVGEFPPYDTVRGLFVEGDPIYPEAGFHKKTHIQICVRERAKNSCIRGVFRVPDDHYL